jgi:hypothetical protein
MKYGGGPSGAGRASSSSFQASNVTRPSASAARIGARLRAVQPQSDPPESDPDRSALVWRDHDAKLLSTGLELGGEQIREATNAGAGPGTSG